MSVPRKIFLFFLCDTPTQGCYYVQNNIVQMASIASGIPLWLPNDPDGWKDITLSFGRDAHYYGLNRSFSVPLRFIEDGATIIRELYYNGKGIETLLSLVILKWNDVTDIYELYYDGQLDLTKIYDDVEKGVGVNLMEGGIKRMLKAYEKITFEIPCDGSIAENIKCNDDGLILDDTFFYGITPFTNSGSTLFSPMPAVFSSNNGDNIGVVHGDQSFDPQTTDTHWYLTSGNYLFSSVDPVTITISGFVTVASENPANGPARFQLKLLTNDMASIADDSLELLSHSTTNGYLKFVTNQRTYYFNKTITLKANERLFLVFLNFITTSSAEQNLKILEGNFNIQFSSRFNATAIWGMTLRDLFKLVIADINILSTQDTEVFNYQTVSTLLDDKLNIFVTSGDAIRASGDTSYSKYFNLKNVDLTTGTIINTTNSFGPVIKTTLSDLFDAVNVVLNACMGDDGTNIFIENKAFVFDSSTVDMDLGDVSNLKITVPNDYFFNLLQIGYPEQQYDEKGGKYEYNTTAEYATPVKAEPQTLALISKYRTDSYGIEKLRSGTATTSTTQNSSDNSVFLINIDFSTFIYDTFQAFFNSEVNNPSIANTNLALIPNQPAQSLPMFNSTGEYFLRRNDSSIFVWTQPNTTLSLALSVTGLLNGLPTDTFTLELYQSNFIIFTQTWTVTGVNTPISITGAVPASVFMVNNDTFYLRGTSSGTAIVELDVVSFTLGGTRLQANSAGVINIPAGSTKMLIPMEDTTTDQVTVAGVLVNSFAFGFDYYLFNSVLINPAFSFTFFVQGFINGAVVQNAFFYTYLNGNRVNIITIPGVPTGTWAIVTGTYQSPVTNWALGDFVFFLGGLQNAFFQLTEIQFIATSQIKAYSLKRVTYDSITGIVHPEAAYNIEEFTPKRLFDKHSNWFKSTMFNLVPGKITWKTLSKNRFLSTTQGTVIFDEDADVLISDMDDPLYLPYIFEFDTEVPDAFATIMNNATNAHVKFSYNSVVLYGFPVEMSQKPSLNESQKWKLLCSPLVNPGDLVDLQFTGLNFLDMFQSYCPTIVGAKFVPMTIVRNPKYNFVDMDSDWFINQFQNWISHSNYYQKVQTTDTTPIQWRTNGLAPVTVTVKNCKGLTMQTFVMNPITTSSLNGTQNLFQGVVNWSILPPDTYYIICQAGSGGTVSTAISEGFWLKTLWPKTMLLEYTHRKNTQSAIFSEGFVGSFRVEGDIIDFNPEADFAQYVDEPEDMDLINGRRYRSFFLSLGFGDGLPDWVIDLVNGITLLSNWMVDGIQYTRDSGAKFEATKFPGQPKKYWSMKIRPAKNFDGVTFGLDGGMVNDDISVVYSIDANAFGQDSGTSNVIEVQFLES